jgi:hypothetical protein
MPFSNNAIQLVGQQLLIKPVFGNGWGLFGQGEPRWFDAPGMELEATVNNALFDNGEARVLICELKITLMTYEFNWGAFLARSDSPVDLGREPVHCNMIFSKQKPSISLDKPYPSPEFVTPNSQPHVRGFGIISLAQAINLGQYCDSPAK